MQSAGLEQPAKRPRCDGSPRTPQNTPPAGANQSVDPDSQSSDLRTWDPEDVCSFLEERGFREKKVLDIFRGSGAEGRGMATEGPRWESPRGRHPKGEARRAEVSGGSGWREPEPGEGGSLTGGEQISEVGTGEVQAHRLALGAAKLREAQAGLHLLVDPESLSLLLTGAIPALRRLYPRPPAVACGLSGSPGLRDPSLLTAAPGTVGPMRDFGRF